MAKHWKIIAAAYVAIGIATFGHSAAQIDAADKAQFAACRADPGAFCWDSSGRAGLGGMIAAILWPFYWSWEAWS